MYNWTVDEKKFKKENPESYKRWRLEQLINFGLNGEKISEDELRSEWDKLRLDSGKKRFMEFLLWEKRS